MAAAGQSPRTIIWIFKNGEGNYRVFPSPVNVASEGEVLFKNWTPCSATLEFSSLRLAPLTLDAQGKGRSEGTITIPPGNGGRYHEYSVVLKCPEEDRRAEGCSPPGFIVDP